MSTYMKPSAAAAVTGVCAAMAAGTAAYMAAAHHAGKAPMKKLKKSAGKAIRSVGDALDHLSCMMQ